MTQYHTISVGGGGNSGGFYREDVRLGGYQGTIRQPSQMNQPALSIQAVGQHTAQLNPWMVDGSDAGSLLSDRDATFSRQYTQSGVNGYTSQMSQGGGTMHRSLSGTLSRGGGMSGGEMEIVQQHSFKGPAHRTISRIANRNRMSMGPMPVPMQRQMSSGGSSYGGGLDRVDRGFVAGLSSASQGNLMQRHNTLSRAMSIKSMQSVGRGVDIFGGQMEVGSGNFSG